MQQFGFNQPSLKLYNQMQKQFQSNRKSSVQKLPVQTSILANTIQAGSQPPVNPQEINPQLQQYPPQYAQYPQYQYPPQYAQYPPPQFANPSQPYPYPNVPLPPQYNPHATNPTMMMTEVSMDPLNLGPVQPKTIETFEIVPQCYHKAFMLPFPFFCMGCCMSQTTKFQFNNQTRELKVMSYCGYCFCCESTETIAFADIISIKQEVNTSCKGKRGKGTTYYIMIFQTRRGESKVTNNIMKNELASYKRSLEMIMTRCGIKFK